MKRVMFNVLAVVAMVMFLTACGTTSKQAMSPADAVKAQMAEAKKETMQVSVDELKQWKADGKKFNLIDARTRKEHAAGFIPGSTNIPRGLFEFLVPKMVQDTAEPIVVYCKVGGRGAFATKTLKDIGYTNVYNLSGGYKAWVDGGNKVDKK